MPEKMVYLKRNIRAPDCARNTMLACSPKSRSSTREEKSFPGMRAFLSPPGRATARERGRCCIIDFLRIDNRCRVKRDDIAMQQRRRPPQRMSDTPLPHLAVMRRHGRYCLQAVSEKKKPPGLQSDYERSASGTFATHTLSRPALCWSLAHYLSCRFQARKAASSRPPPTQGVRQRMASRDDGLMLPPSSKHFGIIGASPEQKSRVIEKRFRDTSS